MTFEERFEFEFKALRAAKGAKNKMDCRGELIRAVERAVEARGQRPVLAAYLRDTFDADCLAELSDHDLDRALRFIAVLEKQSPPRQLMPLVPGMRARGEACWFRGDFDWTD